MSRELKFRARNIDGKLVYSDSFPSLSIFFRWAETNCPNFEQDQQYTGLKDKSGMEIFEKDIVQMEVHKDNSCADHYEDPDPVEGYYIGKVVIRASVGACLVRPVFHDELDDSVHQINSVKGVRAYRSKVIGNVFENPELLEVK